MMMSVSKNDLTNMVAENMATNIFVAIKQGSQYFQTKDIMY
jgi:hypothetical protein